MKPFSNQTQLTYQTSLFLDTQLMQFIFGGFQMQKPNPNECWLWSSSKEVNLTERKPTNSSLPLFNKIFLDIFYSCGTLVLVEIYILYTKFDVKKKVWPLLHMTWWELFLQLITFSAFHASSSVSSVSVSLLIRLINNVLFFTSVTVIHSIVKLLLLVYHP